VPSDDTDVVGDITGRRPAAIARLPGATGMEEAEFEVGGAWCPRVLRAGDPGMGMPDLTAAPCPLSLARLVYYALESLTHDTGAERAGSAS
jgi:hypothetical protein